MSSVPTSIGYMTVTARGVNALASNINAEEMSGTITFTPDVGREPLVAIAEDPKVLVSIDQIVASFDATGALRPPADGKALPITDEGNLLLVAPGQPDNLSVYGWTWTAFFRPGEGQYWRPFAIVFGGLPDETVDLAEQYLLNHPASGGEISSAATVIREGDPRLSDARVPVHHTHSMEDIEDYEPPNLSEYAKTIDIPREPSDIGAAPAIVAAGRPDVPASMDGPTQAAVAGATSGTKFISTDGPQGAWEWTKRGAAWVCVESDTGWLLVPDDALESGWTKYGTSAAANVRVRKVNNLVMFGGALDSSSGSADALWTPPPGFGTTRRGMAVGTAQQQSTTVMSQIRFDSSTINPKKLNIYRSSSLTSTAQIILEGEWFSDDPHPLVLPYVAE